MTTNLGPLDQALHDFCRSLEAPMRAALFPAAKSRLRFPDSAGEMLGAMMVALNSQTAKFDFGAMRRIDLDEHLEEVAASFETPEWTALIEALRRTMPPEAWPITFQVRFYGEQCASECSGLGFANLGSVRPDKLSLTLSKPSDLFHVDPGGLIGIYGLDRIAEAMIWLLQAEVLSAQWNRPNCAWSLLEHEAFSNELDWIGVHAKSELEALLKIALHRDGLEAVRAAYDRRDAAALGARGDAALVPVRLTGLHDDPHGKIAPISDILEEML